MNVLWFLQLMRGANAALTDAPPHSLEMERAWRLGALSAQGNAFQVFLLYALGQTRKSSLSNSSEF